MEKAANKKSKPEKTQVNKNISGIKDEILLVLPEIAAAGSAVIIALFLLFFRTQYIISAIALIGIIIIGLEKRGDTFYRVFSTLLILILCIIFMLI